MGIGDIICEYIYGSFLTIKASLEIIQKTSKLMLRSLDTLFNTSLNIVRHTIDAFIQGSVDSILVFSKFMVDILMSFSPISQEQLCDGLFRCTAFIVEVLDDQSLFTRAMKKYTSYEGTTQAELYRIVYNFDEFRTTFCNFGVTFNFGVDSIRESLKKIKLKSHEYLNKLEKKKEEIRRFIQNYINTLIDLGLFDLLNKLRDFFDCVLVDSEVCTSIATSSSFYNHILSKCRIQEVNGSYTFDTELNNKYLNYFDGKINELSNLNKKIDELIDSFVNPFQTKNYKNAYNLHKVLKRTVKYLYKKINKFFVISDVGLFYGQVKNIFDLQDDIYSLDYIMDNVNLDEENNRVDVSLNNKKITIFPVDFSSFGIEEEILDNELYLYRDDLNVPIDTSGVILDENEKFISILNGVDKIHRDKDGFIYINSKKYYDKFNSYIRETNVVKAY